jgi:hypothetical protein
MAPEKYRGKGYGFVSILDLENGKIMILLFYVCFAVPCPISFTLSVCPHVTSRELLNRY